MVFSLSLHKIISLSYHTMLILLTCKELNFTIFDKVLWVKIFVKGRGEGRFIEQTRTNKFAKSATGVE